MSTTFLRVISNEELADLTDEWENATVDTSIYHQTVLKACECDTNTYHKWNGPKQIFDNRFYIGGEEEI